MKSWFATRWRTVVLAATPVLVTGALLAGGVMAQTPPAGTPGTQTTPVVRPIEDFFSRLAGKLGVSQDQMTTAVKDTQKDMIDEAVASGKLTQEQADALKQRVDSNGYAFIGGFRGKGHGFGRGHGPGLDVARAGLSELATWLNTPADQIRQELASGQSLAQVAEAHGKSRQELITFLTDKVKARLDQAVANGRLTQAQADQMLATFSANVDQLIDRQHQHPRGVAPGQRGTPGAGPNGNGSGVGFPRGLGIGGAL